MKEELLKIAQESLSSEEVEKIVKEKFAKALEDAVDSAFRWGDAKKALENKVKEVMVPYIENYDFSKYLLKLDTVLTELVNSESCLANKRILENFKELMTEPEQKEIKLTELFKSWIKWCEKEIDTDDLEICFDDGVSYCPVECEMRFEKEDKPSWSSMQRAVITFENEHDEFGFGETQCQRFLDRMNQKAECMIDDFCTWEDYIQTIKEELNINMQIRWNK